MFLILLKNDVRTIWYFIYFYIVCKISYRQYREPTISVAYFLTKIMKMTMVDGPSRNFKIQIRRTCLAKLRDREEIPNETIINHTTQYFEVWMQNGYDRSIALPTKWFCNKVLPTVFSLSLSLSPFFLLSLSFYPPIWPFLFVLSISALPSFLFLFLFLFLAASRFIWRLFVGRLVHDLVLFLLKLRRSVEAAKEKLAALLILASGNWLNIVKHRKKSANYSNDRTS